MSTYFEAYQGQAGTFDGKGWHIGRQDAPAMNEKDLERTAAASSCLLSPGMGLAQSVRQNFSDRVPPEKRRFRVPNAKRGKPGCYGQES